MNQRRIQHSRLGRQITDPTDLSMLNLRNLNVADSPDLTRSIMGKLGYMQVAPKIARRHKVRFWINRSGLTLAAFLALGVGVRVYIQGPDIRRPIEMTIPAAIGNDWQYQQNRIGSMINVIRSLAPEPNRHDSLDDQDQLDQPQTIERDSVQPVGAPFRWV